MLPNSSQISFRFFTLVHCPMQTELRTFQGRRKELGHGDTCFPQFWQKNSIKMRWQITAYPDYAHHIGFSSLLLETLRLACFYDTGQALISCPHMQSFSKGLKNDLLKFGPFSMCKNQNRSGNFFNLTLGRYFFIQRFSSQSYLWLCAGPR